MRILICRLSSLGDVACCVPAALKARQLFPEAEIAWAVDPRFAGVVECCPAVDEVIQVKPKWNPSSWPTFDRPFDAVLDLQGLSKSAIVAARAKSKVKLGYHWQREGAQLVSQPVIPAATSIHVVDQYVDVVRALPLALGLDNREDTASLTPPLLAPKPEDLDAVAGKLRDRQVEGPYVLLNPGAGWATKRWPPEHFGTVVDWLWAQGFAPVALGGNGPEDHQAFEEVSRTAGRPPVKMTGETNVRQLVALISGSTSHVGGDTGSSHLAAMLGIPAIGLYSITRPQRSCPYGQPHRCLYDPDSLASIKPEAVIEALERA